MKNTESIMLDDGKYTVVLNSNPYGFKALRYGEEWRDLTGDNLILSMFYKIQGLQEILNKLTGGLSNEKI